MRVSLAPAAAPEHVASATLAQTPLEVDPSSPNSTPSRSLNTPFIVNFHALRGTSEISGAEIPA